MNTQAIKDKMNQYFDTVKPGELIKEFEKLGYVFEDISNPFRGITYTTTSPTHRYPIGSNETFYIEKSKLTTCFFYLLFNRFTKCKLA